MKSAAEVVGILWLLLAKQSFSFTVQWKTPSPRSRKPDQRESLFHQLWVSSESTSQTSDNSPRIDDASELGAWVPVGSVSSLKDLLPAKVEIMGQDFVVWYNQAIDEWSVMTDICPHRLAPLSQGRMNTETGCIECGYHGWQFQTDGNVSAIPQMEPGKDISKVQAATSFSVHLAGDLLWSFLPTSLHGESFPKHIFPDDYYHGLNMDMARKATYYSHEMPASFHMVVENAMDPSHFSFTHHGVIARREDAAPMPDMKVETFNFTHLDVYSSYKRNGVPRERRYCFQRPCLMYTKERVYDEDENPGWVPGSLFFVVPIREGRMRIITSVEKLSKSYMPDWIAHLATKRLLEGDYFTHEAELNLRKREMKYVEPTNADTGPRAWNKWIKTFGFSNSPKHTFGFASKSNLVSITMAEKRNMWMVHTKSCSKCRAVLRRARKAQLWSVLFGILVGSFFQERKRPILAAATLCTGIIASLLAKKIATVLEGSSHPSDIPDRDPAMLAQ